MAELEYIPHPELVEILSGDLEPVLPPNVREAMLDVILAWANLDASTAFFAAALGDLNPDQGADRFKRSVIADKLKAAAKALEELDQKDAADLVRAIGEEYPDRALLRKRIAHSRCAGVKKSDPSRVVFLPYEREGPDGHLAVEVFPLERFASNVEWARGVHVNLMSYVDKVQFFGSD